MTSRLSTVQGLLRRVGGLRQRVDDLSLMFELAEAEGDADALAEAEAELVDLDQGGQRAGGRSPCSPASTTSARRW